MTTKLPIPNNEPQRLEALESYRIMDTAPEERLDNLTQLAADICRVPISLVSLVDGKRQWFKSRVGIDATETPREISFCQYAILDTETFEVENALDDSRFSENPLVTEDPSIRFYAGHPLTNDDGYNLGTLCVIDRVPRKLDEHQKNALKILAKEAVAAIENHKTRRELNGYKKFFDMSLDLHCIAGTDGYFKKINPSFERVLGYSVEEMLPEPFVNFVHPEDIDATNEEVAKLAEGAQTLGFENRYRKKGGGWTHLHWSCQPDTETGELYAVAHDITELKGAINELDQFAYIVSHDLKAPLRAISTLTTFLEEDLEDKLDDDTRTNFNLLKSRVGRMEALINGILAYSRVGKSNQSKEDINVSEILAEIVGGFDKKPGFTISYPNDLPAVYFNQVQLTQVFQNLISNGLKYHDKEKGTIEISCCENVDFHEFHVSDDGPGIAPEYHEKIFEVFQTLQSRDEVESTGVGLSIVRKIIADQDGKVWVESKPGEGSVFKFTIAKY